MSNNIIRKIKRLTLSHSIVVMKLREAHTQEGEYVNKR